MTSRKELKTASKKRVNVAILALFVALGSLLYPVFVAAHSFVMYDNSPALEYHYCSVETEQAIPTKNMIFTCVYNKRPNCEGNITIAMEHAKSIYKRVILIGPIATTWEDAVGFSKTAESRVPVPEGTTPGEYRIHAKTVFTHCDASPEFGFKRSSPNYVYRTSTDDDLTVFIQ